MSKNFFQIGRDYSSTSRIYSQTRGKRERDHRFNSIVCSHIGLLQNYYLSTAEFIKTNDRIFSQPKPWIFNLYWNGKATILFDVFETFLTHYGIASHGKNQ